MKEMHYIKHVLMLTLVVGTMGFFNISYALSPPLTFEQQCSRLAGQKIPKPDCKNLPFSTGAIGGHVESWSGYRIEYQPGASWDGNDFVWRCKGAINCPHSTGQKEMLLPVYLDYQGPQMQAFSRWECKPAPKCKKGHYPLYNLKGHSFHCTHIQCKPDTTPVIINNTSFSCELIDQQVPLGPPTLGQSESGESLPPGPPSTLMGTE